MVNMSNNSNISDIHIHLIYSDFEPKSTPLDSCQTLICGVKLEARKDKLNINFDDLKKFLYDANANSYAGAAKEIAPQRPGFDELEYKKGDWYFRDSYVGSYFAPGQEFVYFKGKPVWAMAYAGGMKFKYHGEREITKETIVFLKKSLIAMEPDKPYRGPVEFAEGEFRYISTLNGDIKDFIGNEKIYKGDKLVFEQNFIGGIVVDNE